MQKTQILEGKASIFQDTDLSTTISSLDVNLNGTLHSSIVVCHDDLIIFRGKKIDLAIPEIKIL